MWFSNQNFDSRISKISKNFFVDDDENVDKAHKEQNKSNENNSEKNEDIEKNNNNNEK